MAINIYINTLIIDYWTSMISIQELATCCHSGTPLTPKMISQLKELTITYHQNYHPQKTLLYIQCWKVLGQSVDFWGNISLLYTSGLGHEANLNIFVLIRDRIKTKWYCEDQQIKNTVIDWLKSLLASFGNEEISNNDKILFRKINQIIVQVLKYEWNHNPNYQGILDVFISQIQANQKIAQNQFDLIRTILSQIFSPDQDSLIEEQIKALKVRAINSYKNFQKCCEKYLKIETCANVVKNCILALLEYLNLIPSYYIYIGNVIEQLFQLFKRTDQKQYKQQPFICLLSILSLPCDETLLAKFYGCKRNILMRLLADPLILKRKTLIPKLMHATATFLQQQRKDVIKYGDQVIFKSKEEIDMNTHIILRLIEIMNNCQESLQIHNYEMVVMYKLIVILGKNQVQLQKIIENLIEITPAPFPHPHHLREEPNEDDGIEETRKDFTEMMKNLLNNQLDRYFEFIYKELDQDFFSHKSYKILELILNNVYYCLETCPPHIQIKQKLFMLISKLLNIDEKIAKSKPSQDLPKLAKTVKLGMHLILGHQRCRNTIFQSNLYSKYLTTAFIEEIQFVLSLLYIIMGYYANFSMELKKVLHKQYVKAMAIQDDRLEADLKYVEIVGKWVESNYKQNNVIGLEFTADIVDGYMNSINQLKNRKLSSISNSQRKQFERKMFNIALDYLKIVHVSMPYLKAELIYHIHHELPIIQQIKALIKVSDSSPDQTTFFRLALKILAWSFSLLSIEQVNKNLNIFLPQCQIVIEHILNDLQTDKVSQQNLGSMLDYLSQFVISLGGWAVDETHKVALTNKIMQTVLSRNYSFLKPGFCNFLHSIIKCPTLPLLQPGILAAALPTVFTMGISENEQHIVQSLNIMETIYTECITSPGKQKLLSNYIINCINNTYVIIVKLLYAKHFMQEYSDVLFMGLALFKNMKQKFTFNGFEVASNIQALLNVLVQTTRNVNLNYTEEFIQKITAFIKSLLIENNDMKTFCERIKDLVVVLRRCY